MFSNELNTKQKYQNKRKNCREEGVEFEDEDGGEGWIGYEEVLSWLKGMMMIKMMMVLVEKDEGLGEEEA